MTNNNVYIKSIEASELVGHMTRNDYIKGGYEGMIPYSLQLIQLKKQGMETFTSKRNSKEMSNDIINVKFSQNLKSGTQLLNYFKETISKLDNTKDIEYKQKLEEVINNIEETKEDVKWNVSRISEMRENLYANGFTITQKDGTENHYKLYIRSSSKSRNGECLFIRDGLHTVMTKWNRMNIDIPEGTEIDLASIRGYESLNSSGIVDTLRIDPNNILMINDYEFSFNQMADVVTQNENGDLVNSYEDTVITNDIWDGQALLDSSYFPEREGFKLLRNHMFKSAAFNTNIQEYYKDQAEVLGKDYDNWTVRDMFNNKIKVKDIHLITTPNSLKALKFSYLVGDDADMFQHWKDIVNEDGNKFGVCFSESQSPHTNDDGITMRELSYQIVNSLPATQEDIKELSQFELEYVEKLKNNDDVFIQHLYEGASEQNSNEMYVEVYNKNKDIVNTKSFKNVRKRTIANHVIKCKTGRIRVKGDYLVMLGDGFEMLQASIGQFDVNNTTLQPEEIYSTMFENGQELAGFRNPHTSASNISSATNNLESYEITRYFNLTNNIVIVTTINSDLSDRYSGSDFDSDTALYSSEETLVRLAKESNRDYPVVINAVQGSKVKYKLNAEDMYKVDNDLSTSTQMIGVVTNKSQQLLSVYWDNLTNGRSTEGMLDSISNLVALSGLSIDLAKVKVDLDIMKTVRDIDKTFELKEGKNPNFWVNVSKNPNTRKNITFYNTAMDYLDVEFTDLKPAKRRKTITMDNILEDIDQKKTNRNQRQKVSKLIEELQNDVLSVQIGIKPKSESEQKEKINIISEIQNEYFDKIGRYRIKEDTMYSMLCNTDKSQTSVRLMNVLYKTQRDVFLSVFKEN